MPTAIISHLFSVLLQSISFTSKKKEEKRNTCEACSKTRRGDQSSGCEVKVRG